MRTTPLNRSGSDGNISERNFADSPKGGSVIDTAGNPAGEPSSRVKSNIAVVGSGDVFATAIPVCMLPGCPGVPDDSTNTRSALPVTAGTPASETVIRSGLKEKTTSAPGAGPSPVGMMRTGPNTTLDPDS